MPSPSNLQLTLTGGTDLGSQLYRQLRDAVLDGRLRDGERLPATRELARDLAVSRNTVAGAYDRLTAEGFLAARVGAGTFVRTGSGRPRSRRSAPAGVITPRPVWRELVVSSTSEEMTPAYDFRIGIPDGRLFPVQTWRRLLNRQLRTSMLTDARYRAPGGHPSLRAAIARHLGVSRSVHAAAEDVLVTRGAQQAVDLVARVLVEPGDCVVVEDPGYPPVRQLMRSLGARVVPVPVDDEGLVVHALPRQARLVHTTPSHQFPMGVAMSLARRRELVEWAARHRAAVIEDDYDTEFRYTPRPLEPLQTLDRYGRVIYVGTFAKTMLPLLRTGFLVAPASLRPALLAARQLSDWHGDRPTEAALAAFLDEGFLARHIRRAGAAYAERRATLLAAVESYLADWFTPAPSAAGLHIALRSRPDATVDLAALVTSAAEADIGVQALSDFSADGDHLGLVLGFGAMEAARIRPGVRKLARLVRQFIV
ncbi:MAG TPA: PLP-dependent aminotransferase family protein [Propionibacteriaceae bacterium]|nr:PLP-dependent aminotransferase family protein [Propionibacteriaceae bacterium]